MVTRQYQTSRSTRGVTCALLLLYEFLPEALIAKVLRESPAFGGYFV
ncbi:unnamed protein product [Acanthoscelides obtectus]|uniref:Uncharacterized protein n=1 Tax=Acanthoscelides obtectus TaxID=200917 RepID=A0A9P0PIQ3_ACAOB|nr:unnamed protein product [Acanthoscelides obtectus]CAK1663130.1 hypothetical protein AOBTE_LOCUS23494 [Acanthoscelides obtectus]